MRRAVEGEGQEQHIGRRGQRRFGEEGAGEEGQRQAELEEGGQPGEEQRRRKAGRGDVARGGRHAGELEAAGHQEHGGEDQPGDQDCDGLGHFGCSFPSE